MKRKTNQNQVQKPEQNQQVLWEILPNEQQEVIQGGRMDGPGGSGGMWPYIA